MLLNEDERALLRARGVIVFEKCDACGNPITQSFVWKFAGKPETYCSQVCRDGVARTPGKCEYCGASLEGKRRGTRFCGSKCRMRFIRSHPDGRDVANPAQVEETPNIGNSDLAVSSS